MLIDCEEYDLNELNELDLDGLLEMYAYGSELVCGEISFSEEDREHGREIMKSVKEELSRRMS